ncbi:restriction endonuclease subunit S [Niveispirillum sp. BGYR6]|uniref:restriction endonuclease subunit S n=1 Tax=Niveispirillum sp. BGYR6 TaxID=2971249 RepID=UPI0022B99B5C|nr:restriction endonuclease subunit S [Niveispirillum sp. BGYR6]MDG5498032.1 restriction endonuclease subunit S [Niveispirillum sp. BGYR6]
MSRELPPGWVEATFGELIHSAQNGFTGRGGVGERSMVVLRLADVEGYAFNLNDTRQLGMSLKDGELYRLNKGDLVCIRVNGSSDIVGRLIFFDSDEECAFCDHFIRIKLKDSEVNGKYISYYFRTRSARRHIESSFVSSAGQKTVSQSNLSLTSIPLPPLPEQHRIVERIEALLAKGARAKAALDALPPLLDRYRQSLLAAAFRGDLTADWRGKDNDHAIENISDIDQVIGKKRSNGDGRGENSSIPKGWVAPEGWNCVPLSSIVECYDRLRVPVSKSEREKLSGDFPYYGANGQVGWINNYIFDGSYILVTEDETFYGRVKPIAYAVEGKFWVNNHAHIIKAKSGINQEWLLYTLMRYDVIPYLTGTTGRAKLTQAALLNLPILLPPRTQQDEIARVLRIALGACDKAEETVKSLSSQHTTLTQSILAKAFRGELVPQDPADEPASVLLARIRAERGEKPKRGRARKEA